MKNKPHVKCNIVDCLLNIKLDGVYVCDNIVPSIIKNCTPNSKSCKYYSNDLQEDMEIKKQSTINNSNLTKGR